VRNGKAHFDDRITLTAADQVQGSGVLRLFDAPLTLTLKDVLTMMIIMSDNSATNLVIDHLGLRISIPGSQSWLGRSSKAGRPKAWAWPSAPAKNSSKFAKEHSWKRAAECRTIFYLAPADGPG
jgi:beta-lactamase class A